MFVACPSRFAMLSHADCRVCLLNQPLPDMMLLGRSHNALITDPLHKLPNPHAGVQPQLWPLLGGAHASKALGSCLPLSFVVRRPSTCWLWLWSPNLPRHRSISHTGEDVLCIRTNITAAVMTSRHSGEDIPATGHAQPVSTRHLRSRHHDCTMTLTKHAPASLPRLTLTLAAATAKRQLPAGDDAADQVLLGWGNCCSGIGSGTTLHW